jgi:hypothetical protein
MAVGEVAEREDTPDTVREWWIPEEDEEDEGDDE